jgi:hypothetical protein
MTATKMVMTMAMAVSMYGVLRFHFGTMVDLRYRGGTTGDCAQFHSLPRTTRVHLSRITPFKAPAINVQQCLVSDYFDGKPILLMPYCVCSQTTRIARRPFVQYCGFVWRI